MLYNTAVDAPVRTVDLMSCRLAKPRGSWCNLVKSQQMKTAVLQGKCLVLPYQPDARQPSNRVSVVVVGTSTSVGCVQCEHMNC